MTEESPDAIVVGSGISGGWAAKELTEGGLRVLLLERGENIEHITGYVNALKPPWALPHRNRMTREMGAAHGVHAVREDNASFAVDDRLSPYVQAKPFTWYRGYHVGGRSLMWGRQCYRWSDFDFEANGREGVGVDWPIRYADLAPWYDHVESFAGVSGSLERLPQLPDGQFLPPMEMTCVERAVAGRIGAHYGGARRMIIGRTANLTVPHNGRTNCQYRNKCDLGCPFGAYFSTQSSTLPAAMKTGRLTLRPFSIVSRILYDRDRGRATGVEVLDAQTRELLTFRSRIVFLCASTFNSAWVLMRSATDVWPGGLGSSSGELGHNVMDHQTRAGANGRVDGFEDRTVFGRRANGPYIARYKNLFGERRAYLRGFGYQGGSGRDGWQRGVAELGIGAGWKESLTEPGSWSIGMAAFGEILPNHANTVSLDPSLRDAWGLPVLSMDCATGENERLMRVDMMNDAAEMLEAAGVKDVTPFDQGYHLGQSSHEMGAARMGRDPRSSVLNGRNQLWDAPNVFVTDGACMASSACVNPSLTYMALTARAAAFAIDALKRRDL